MSLRASGQVAYEVKSHEQILELTLEAWGSMEQSTFSAAWLSCGYVDVAQMNLHGPGDPRRIVEEARASLSDMFSCLGKTGHHSVACPMNGKFRTAHGTML